MTAPFRILVTGSRAWTNVDVVEAHLASAIYQHVPAVIVHGGCPTGADAIAGNWARRYDYLGLTEETWPADWSRHGRAAGPIRNAAMVAAGADVMLAFPLGASRGTRGCMRLAEAAGIRVVDCTAGGDLR